MKSLGWANVVLGVWLIIAPWVLGYVDPTAETQDVVVGILITVISVWALSTAVTNAGAAWAQLGLAVWLFIGPWVLGYANASPAFTNDLIVSILIVTFAIASTARRRIPADHPTGVGSRQ
jgi:SPW repeat-containing protein